MDEYDRERAHHQAKERARDMYDQHYVEDNGADQYNPNQYGPPDHIRREGGYDNNY